ncbi:hypothetical protein GUJ93_ZPchr0013g34697 [Zizania palustris]|uniref:RRM domain-containing protein n=1 Tax=Zizania palustris TaxID=103762 RepID=A0A8J5WUF9_ZIZPA|nr:hypothetical protein GUJ93_ZPchr0604g7107 [Zizania palustris]KAG8098150.1 hypothetical protein GUJ93_ZPchr0013g34697 [Zizania palustris]
MAVWGAWQGCGYVGAARTQGGRAGSRGRGAAACKATGCREGRRVVMTVQVRNISDLAGEHEVREFFSFSGEIEHVDLKL